MPECQLQSIISVCICFTSYRLFFFFTEGLSTTAYPSGGFSHRNVYSFFDNHDITDEKVISIGPSTEKALKDNGVDKVVVSWEPSEIALADSVMSFN